MKRLWTVCVMLLAGCGGGTLHLSLNSDDSGTVRQGLNGAADLTGVQHVNVTFKEIDVHLAGKEVPDDVKGDEVKDDDKGWQVVTTKAQTIDLMTVRQNAEKPLGDIALPDGKITQIRLKLDGVDSGNGDAKIAGAVVDADGTTCDLIVPESVVNPGLKIAGAFKAIAMNRDVTAVVNMKLATSSKDTTATCAFRLDPVLEIKRVEVGEADGGESHQP